MSLRVDGCIVEYWDRSEGIGVEEGGGLVVEDLRVFALARAVGGDSDGIFIVKRTLD